MTPPPTDVASLAHASLSAALSLVFPTWCAGCDAPDTPLCAACRATLAPRVLTRSADGLRVSSGLAFEGVAARILRAAKEDGRTGLLRALAPALGAAVEAALAAASAGPVVLVPVPTSPGAMRRRGYRVVETIARRAHLPLRRLLVVGAGAADQRRLGRAERADNVAGAMRARVAEAMHTPAAAGLRVIVIDDVVTTGATLGEATRALTAAGAHVLGAATVASTPRRSATAGAEHTQALVTGNGR
ncbi:MAG: ComF family protein [Microbacterium sp.]|uniref:ComF family protein n=1 Tax=Microbacterium sp. TaxID=51671 RepID=UPI001AC5E1D0|nr:phosphoribosyltransferase family protein [Microbacterium sp.]MBN9178493.1 ComF family protein [Microbacterium sp.]